MITDNIVIIGLPGVGKTTIGKILAKKLSKEFIDLDGLVELQCGVDADTIFAFEGEEGFKKREAAILNKIISTKQNYVLAVGGGSVNTIDNCQLLTNSNQIIIHLYAKISCIIPRLKQSINKRPIFNSNISANDIKDELLTNKLTQLYNERQAVYNQLATINLNISNQQKHYVVKQILAKLGYNNINKFT